MIAAIVIVLVLLAAGAVALALFVRHAVESAREDERARHLVDKFERDALDEAEKKRRQIADDLAAEDAKIDAMAPKELEGKLNE